MAADLTGIVTNAFVKQWMAALDLLQGGAHAGDGQRYLRSALGIGAEHAGYMDRDGHGSESALAKNFCLETMPRFYTSRRPIQPWRRSPKQPIRILALVE